MQKENRYNWSSDYAKLLNLIIDKNNQIIVRLKFFEDQLCYCEYDSNTSTVKIYKSLDNVIIESNNVIKVFIEYKVEFIDPDTFISNKNVFSGNINGNGGSFHLGDTYL